MRTICSLVSSLADNRVCARSSARPLFLGALLLVFTLGIFHIAPARPAPQSSSDWVVTWSAEFNGPDGFPPNPAKWTPMGGGNGWGNNELQSYTSRLKNVHVE